MADDFDVIEHENCDDPGTLDLCCSAFQSKMLTPTKEPSIVCCTKDQILVATANSTVEVHGADAPLGHSFIHRFSTQDTVKSMLYNERFAYIATIETRRSRQGGVYSVARGYVHWQNSENKKQKARLAGRKPSTDWTNEKGEWLEVLELATNGEPSCIASCDAGGNLAVGADFTVTVFKYESYRNLYADFVRLMKIEFSFPICICCISEDIVAAASPRCAQVVRVVFSNASAENRVNQSAKTLHSTPMVIQDATNSAICRSKMSSIRERKSTTTDCNDSEGYEIIDKYHQIWTFDDVHVNDDNEDYVHIDVASDRHVFSDDKTTHFPSIVRSRQQWAKEAHCKTEVMGPVHVLPGREVNVELKDFFLTGDLETKRASAVTLLFRQVDEVKAEFITVHLLPIYSRSQASLWADDENFLHSSRYKHLIGSYVFLSGEGRGFMYELTNHVSLITTYNFFRPIRKVWFRHTLMYALTDEGVHTYTTRHLIPSLWKLRSCDHVTWTCPDWLLEICRLGNQRLIGIEDMSMTRDHVVVLCKAEAETRVGGRETSWCVHALACPDHKTLVDDMMEQALRLETITPDDSHHLLQEVQIIVQHAMTFIPDQNNGDLQSRLETSAQKLAQYYSSSDGRNWERSLPYYKMSNLSLGEIVRQQRQLDRDFHQLPLVKQSVTSNKGFENYLIHELGQPGPPIEMEEDLCMYIMETISGSKPSALADISLRARLRNAPDEVVRGLLLKCRLPRKGMDSTSKSAYVSLALAVICLNMADLSEAEEHLLSIDKSELVKALCHFPNVIITPESGNWTPLAHLLQSKDPSLFVDMLVVFFHEAITTFQKAVQLLESNTSRLSEFLEAIVGEAKYKEYHVEAARILVPIYIEKIRTWQPPSSRNVWQSSQVKARAALSARYKWLDLLPPFVGASPNSPCIYMRRHAPVLGAGEKLVRLHVADGADGQACHCNQCNQTLMALQSLLCWPDLDPSITDLVKSMLESLSANERARGLDSVLVLTTARTDWRATSVLLMEMNPRAITQFARDMFGDDHEKYGYLLERVCENLRQKTNAGVSVEIYKDLLSQMCAVCRPDQLLTYLPDDGDVTFFLPYLDECCHRKLSSKLYDVIMNTMTKRIHHDSFS